MKNISKVLEKKLAKEKDLCDAAYNLFSTKGVHETAIDEIVKKAGVAKGTFYLYFKDKYDIFDKVILNKSSIVLKEAIGAVKEKNILSFEDQLIFFIDYIIEYFKNNKIMLKLIYKNLSWGIYRKAIATQEHYEEMREVFNYFIENLRREQTVGEDPGKILFMIIELTGSVCYSSIILGEPDSIDNMKPLLFKMIKKMISE